MKKLAALILFLGLYGAVHAQNCETYFTQDQAGSIEKDVVFLADDKLEGRAPGTQGALLARDYIANRYIQAGLIPMGPEGSYFQGFKVPEPVLVDVKTNTFSVGDVALDLGTTYYPTQNSSNGSANGKTIFVGFGIDAPEMKYNDYAKIKSLSGKIAVMDVSSPDGIHPHSAYAKYHDLQNRIALAKQKGAVGVILVNLGTMANSPETTFKKIRSAGIPVVFVADENVAKSLKKSKTVKYSVSVKEQTVDAYNVIGYVDNGQPTTIVIGAHYDHLGWGGEGSLYAGEAAIHNGADDNASGTAGLIALAEFFGNNKNLNKHNYLFIAFTAEERGLLGSNYYVNHPTIPLKEMAYMINMDMVGRLRDGNLQVSGTGTSTEFITLFNDISCEDINFKNDPSGVGPSDHSSFYNMQIPVLHFFTGSHEDYHKPTDDADKVNYMGIVRVISIIKYVIATQNDNPHLDFQETKNDNSRNAPRFSVTLGIMPDYLYDAGGVRIDGVSADKPAANAGLEKGDILLQLGDFVINDMQGYMTALSAFKKGDKTTVVVQRGDKKIETKIQF